MTTEKEGPGTERAAAVSRPRALARRRRRASAVRFWRQYRGHRAGVFGLAALLLFALLALAAPLLVGSDVDDVTDAPGGPLEGPGGGSRSAPTGSGGTCSAW